MNLRAAARFAWLLPLLVSSVACSSSSDDETSSTGSEVPTTKIDRSGMTDVGLEPLDYTNPNLWVCRPGNDPDECTRNLDVTVFNADGTSTVEKHEVAKDPKFDCFYVYPTVDLVGTGNMTNFADISHVLDALMSQGARFSKLCRMFAPLYRQAKLGSVGSGGGGDLSLGEADVTAAFDEYLTHFNNGRKFVLMGHSQGTFVLQSLMLKRFENDPAMRSKLISALLIGGLPTVPVQGTVGGTFKNIPTCTTPGQVGCMIGYNSFAVEAPPPDNAAFGKIANGLEPVCTDPGPLSNNTGRSRRAYMPKDIATPTFVPNLPEGQLPAFDTPFAAFTDIFRGKCVRTDAYHYFEVSLEPQPGEKRSIAPYRNSITEGIGFGLHIADYNLVLDDLIEAVRLQAEAALAQ